MNANLYAQARILPDPPLPIIKRWLRAGWLNLKRNMGFSLCYGGVLTLLSWLCTAGLLLSGKGWVLLPLLAGAVLVGPLAAVGLYARTNKRKKPAANTMQVVLVGAILMVFALTWIRAATVMFAIVFGLRPFSSFADTLLLMSSTPAGWALLLAGSLVGGLFAALGFAVSAFSLPMLTDREIDGFSAMGLSFNATTHNFRLCLCWGAVITVLTTLGIATGFLGLIVIFPWLGYATWHAYADLFQGKAS